MPMHHGTTEAEYNAMRGLRQSTIKAVLKNPAKWQHEQNNPPAEKKHFTIGSAVHSLALTDGSDVVRVDVENWKTKAAQEQRDQALTDGLYPLTNPEWHQANAMATELQRHPTIAKHLASGQTEVAITGIDTDTFTPVKARLDIVDVEARTIIDPKTTTDADPYEFGATAYRYGYHIQDAHYIDLIAQETGTHPDEWRFLFALVEKGTAHALRADGTRAASWHGVSVVELDAEARARGRRDRQRGITRYLQATRTGKWDGYPTDVVQASLPKWSR